LGLLCYTKGVGKHYNFEGIENFRDMGGYECSYGFTHENIIFRSGSLGYATPNDIEKLKTLGIKSVLDLRSKKDKVDYPNAFKKIPCVKIYELNVNGEGRIPLDRKDQMNSYFEMIDDVSSAQAIFKCIMEAEKPLVVHCNAGKDRTGVFMMLVLLANGVSLEDINADYNLSFSYLDRLNAYTNKNYPNSPKVVKTYSHHLVLNFLKSFLKKYGSLRNYFSYLGFNDDQTMFLENLLGYQERSYGAVLVKDNLTLVEHMRMEHISLPKGHIEKGDLDGRDTALREIKEETGFDAEIANLDNRYDIFYSPLKGHVKRVTFFIGKYIGGKQKAQKEEIESLEWMSFDEAIKSVTHQSDKEVLIWARGILGL